MAALVEADVATRLALGFVFVAAGVAKTVWSRRFAETLYLARTVPPGLVPLVRVAVPPLELGAGALVAAGALHPFGAVACGLLLLAFTASTWKASTSGSALPCGCFGVAGTRLDRGMIVRNVVLAGYAAFAGLASRGSLDVLTRHPLGSGGSLAVWLAVAGLLVIPFLLAEVVALWDDAPRVRAAHA